MTTILSDRLLALLYESKRSYGKDIPCIVIAKNALVPLYSTDMSIMVMLNHCLNACVEICQTPEFINSSETKLSKLITSILYAPYNYSVAKNGRRLYPDLHDKISLNEIYETQLIAMINIIVLTNIDWSDQYKEYCKNKSK